jgi:hypothetical protein
MIEDYFGNLLRVNKFAPCAPESNGCESLRDFTRSSRIRTMSPLDLTVHIVPQDFGSSCFGDLNSQIKNSLQLFPGVRYLLKSVSSQINDSRLFVSPHFLCFKFQLPPSSKYSKLLTRTLLDSMVLICSSSPSLHAPEVSSLKLDSLCARDI